MKFLINPSPSLVFEIVPSLIYTLDLSDFVDLQD
jgi:hypothetical protein